MLNYFIDNDRQFPDLRYLKREIGHDIELLHVKAREMRSNRNLKVSEPDSPIHTKIIRLLSQFAKGDRYSNINLLTGKNEQPDPISTWFKEVDIPLFEARVSEKKKTKIAGNAKLISDLMSQIAMVLHTSETGSEITNIEEGSFRTGIFEAVAPYRQLYVLQIIRYWSDCLCELQYQIQRSGSHDVPWFSELFAGFRNKDSYLRTRKTWDTI